MSGSKDEYQFLSVDNVEQKTASLPEDANIPDFGFTFVLSRAPKIVRHSRSVQSFVELLAMVGGLDYLLVMFLSPLLSLYSAGFYYRSILNSKFKYEDSKSKLEPGDKIDDKQILVSRLDSHKKGKLEMSGVDLDTIKEAFDSLIPYRINLF